MYWFQCCSEERGSKTLLVVSGTGSPNAGMCQPCRVYEFPADGADASAPPRRREYHRWYASQFGSARKSDILAASRPALAPGDGFLSVLRMFQVPCPAAPGFEGHQVSRPGTSGCVKAYQSQGWTSDWVSCRFTRRITRRDRRSVR